MCAELQLVEINVLFIYLGTEGVSPRREGRYSEDIPPNRLAVVERKSGTQPMDSIPDIISNIPAPISSQELSWRLTRVDRLNRLSSLAPSAPTDISTEPHQEDVIDEILGLLHYFQSPSDQRLRAKLTEIISMVIKLWSALRKDSCRADFNYDPSTGDWQESVFVDTV